jgi:uncharacterized protein YkwD
LLVSIPSANAIRQTAVLRRLAVLLTTVVLALVPLVAAAQLDDPSAEDRPPLQAGTLDRINWYRAEVGVPPASLHAALTESASGHVRYYDANQGSPALTGLGLHLQQPDTDGFTGASIRDRARAAGYTDGAVTENAGFGNLDAAVDWYMGTVNHRLPLIHPNAVDIGMAHSGATGFGIIDVGVRGQAMDIDVPSVYPPDGASNVPSSWDGAETPDPAPGVPRPLGYPITVAFARSQQVEWVALELLDAEGAPLEISTPRTDWMRAAAIIPHHPLAAGSAYTARVEARVDGTPVTKVWSFTTRG